MNDRMKVYKNILKTQYCVDARHNNNDDRNQILINRNGVHRISAKLSVLLEMNATQILKSKTLANALLNKIKSRQSAARYNLIRWQSAAGTTKLLYLNKAFVHT